MLILTVEASNRSTANILIIIFIIYYFSMQIRLDISYEMLSHIFSDHNIDCASRKHAYIIYTPP